MKICGTFYKISEVYLVIELHCCFRASATAFFTVYTVATVHMVQVQLAIIIIPVTPKTNECRCI